jgi:hypothetical protein
MISVARENLSQLAALVFDVSRLDQVATFAGFAGLAAWVAAPKFDLRLLQ